MLKQFVSKAGGESKPEAYPRGYVEDFDEPTCLREALRRRQGTTLADGFSILLG
ncbi:MAG: hypothetical protein HOP00_08825 [Nitrospira sp.]|nr:hypothetical protein [Nitrospira sp.]